MKKWLKLSLILLFFAIISVVIYFILRAFDITDLTSLKSLIEKTGKYGMIVFFSVEVCFFVLLCFVPVLNSAMVVLGCVLFGVKTGFFLSFLANFCSSSLLFLLGDRFGEHLARKLIGKEELENAQDLIDQKSKIILPLCFLLPGLPDDALCIVAGMTKMKYSYFALITVIFRGIDTAIMCFFSSGVINYATLTVLDWLIIANLIVVDIFLIIKLEKWLQQRNKKDKK